MALTAMPKGWVLESGTLGTDLDENRVDYATGGRSLEFNPRASGSTIVLSEPIAVADGSYVDQVRTKLGLTATYYVDALPAASTGTTFGFRFYDASGNYISKTTVSLPVSQGRVWLTKGIISDCPSTAQFARPYVDYASTANPLLLDLLLPYVMPPFGRVDAVTDLDPITGLGTWHGLTCSVFSGGGASGTHCIDSPFGLGNPEYFEVQETGVYHVSFEVDLDDFAAGDSFMLRMSYGGLYRYSPVFYWNTTLAASGIPAGAPHMQFFSMCPASGLTAIAPEICQLTGSSLREVTDSRLYITKET